MALKGLDQVLKNLNKEVRGIKGRTLKGLIRAAIIIRRDMEYSSPKVPVDTGNLRSSFFLVTSDGSVAEGDSATFRDKKGAKASSMRGVAAKLASDHSAVVSNQMSSIKASKNPKVILGFSAYYAWYVHEMVGANYGRSGGGAKFLESAIKKNQSRILKIIADEAKIPK